MTTESASPPGRVGVHLFRPAGRLTDALRQLRRTVADLFAAGVDVVSFGEHHDRTAGYLADAWSLAAVIAAEDPARTIGVYPYLAGLRAPGLAIEAVEAAAALHPGQLAVALAPGYATVDLELSGVSLATARTRTASVLDTLVQRHASGELADVELLLAGDGRRTVARAAQTGAGLLLPPLPGAAEADVADRYLQHGGTGRIVVQRWLAIGDADMSMYRSMGSPWSPELIPCRSGADLAAILDAAFAITGVGEVSVRVGGPTDASAVSAPAAIEILSAGCELWAAHEAVAR